jgi:hypothetical protein
MDQRNLPAPVRYTVAGIALVALAWLGLIFLIGAGFIMIAFAAPFAGFYAAAVIGYSGAISEAHEFAKRRARPVSMKAPASERPRVVTIRRAESRST